MTELEFAMVCFLGLIMGAFGLCFLIGWAFSRFGGHDQS